MNRKRPNQPRFDCIICRKECRDSSSLKTHLMGSEHHTKTFNMWILPDVGSSIEYTGRDQKSLTVRTHTSCVVHSLGVGDVSAGCKHARSEEELRVWMAALIAKRHERHDRRYSHSASNKGHSTSRSYSSSSQEGACRYPSESSESHSQA